MIELKKKSILDLGALIEAFDKHGISEKHAKTISRHVIQNKTTDLSKIPNIPVKALQIIENEFKLFTCKVIDKSNNKDGSTTKLLIELQVRIN